MFTGIIETIGKVVALEPEGSNLHLLLSSDISAELKIDQSVAHNGVCLTVVGLEKGMHRVTAVAETLSRSNLGDLRIGDEVNLERAMLPSMRLDGHLVQGHVDGLGQCVAIADFKGSWGFEFDYPAADSALLVDKGSIAINGVSLTVIRPSVSRFSIAIIPYTFAHTGFQRMRPGDRVNIEYDIIGKYVARHLAHFSH